MSAFLLLATALGGCGLIGELTGQSQPQVIADVEVFNRTLEPFFLVAADGERLDVPACGDARDVDFRVERVEVRTDLGHIHTFGWASRGPGRDRLVLVETERSDEAFPLLGVPPEPLPPCVGHPVDQPGG
jgi:hypothetical protein